MESNEDIDAGGGELKHLGIKRRSGRYPWGSGQEPFQRSKDFKAYYAEMKAAGLKDTEIADLITAHLKKQDVHASFSTTDLRAATSISTEVIREQNVAQAKALRYGENPMSNVAIAKEMGTRESTIRGWLKETDDIKANSLRATADTLKEHLESKPFLDVGKGTNLYLGVSGTKFDTAVSMLKDEGYQIHHIKNPQVGTGEMTNYKVLTKEGVTWSEARKALTEGRLSTVASQSDDNGQTFSRVVKEAPVSLPLKKVAVRYAEDGGNHMDGVIELRRGADNLSLGAAKYAQIRMAVNGTHYLKGMAIYADDLPDGVDVRFNTNKSKTDSKIMAEGKLGAMKPMKVDSDGNVDVRNPFGAATLPRMYKDKNGKEKLSALNIVNEEGKWDTWSRNLSSQFLSKQSVTLASTQLKAARTKREQELKDIMSLTNPLVREKYLREYADAADAASVHLKAAKMPRQSTHVLLPMNSVRPHEIFAPNFKPGEKVVLVRHPHGGPFEIPELTVNNSNPKAKRIMGGAKDAVGIHWTVAEQLSGADFDGDTVAVIPNDSRKVKTQRPLPQLQNFDAKAQYKIPDDDKTTTRMTKANTQREMGGISNLITDMSLKQAPSHEIARAVKHSMVVIDAEKHGLDYKRSAKDNNIAELKKTYQGKANAGAATIISRASSTDRVPHQKARNSSTGGPPIDPKTGKKVFVPTGDTRTVRVVDKKTGEIKYVQEPKFTKGKKMEFVDDARQLLSGGDKNDKVTADRGYPMERIYADHANSMKALANQARKEMVAIRGPKQSAIAKASFVKEAKSLDAKLKIAQRNAPLERRAQVVAQALTKARIDATPGLDKDDIKKIRNEALEEARLITDAKKIKIGSVDPATGKSTLTDREWDAIQSGAIASTKVREILANADMDRVRELATPRASSSLTPGQMARARQMESQGRSIVDIADALDLPRTTVADNLTRKQ